jgi:transposase
MHYFFSADVAKKNCVIAGCDENEKPVISRRRIANDRQGFSGLVRQLNGFAGRADGVHFLVEASGNLHENLVRYLAVHAPTVRLYVVNPLVAKRYGTSTLRRNHTDADDAAHLLHLLVKEWANLHAWEDDPVWTQLRRVTRERDRLVRDRTRQINRLGNQLHLAFPEFTQVFSNLTQRLALALLAAYPTAADFARRRLDALARFQAEGRGCRPLGKERAARLIALAKDSVASATSACEAELLRHTVSRIELLNQQIAWCERQAQKFLSQCEPPTAKTDAAENDAPSQDATDPIGASETPTPRAVLAHQAALITPMPAMGRINTPLLCARAGDIRRFQTADALAAFLGTCPSRHQTGSSKDTAFLTPYADKTFRNAMFLGTISAIKSFPPLRFYYQWLRERHRTGPNGPRRPHTHKQAVVACMNRIIHWVWTVVTSDTPFDPQRIYANCRHQFPQRWEEFLQSQSLPTEGGPR